MISELRFQWRLSKLQRDKNKIQKYYKRKIHEAKNDNDTLKKDRLIGEINMEEDLINDEIGKLMHRHYIDLSQRYLIPTPNFSYQDNIWTQSDIDGLYRLSNEALHNLRDEIRKERKYRFGTFLSFISAFTGIIGALTGLFSVIL